jgi:hypothetical protein
MSAPNIVIKRQVITASWNVAPLIIKLSNQIGAITAVAVHIAARAQYVGAEGGAWPNVAT